MNKNTITVMTKTFTYYFANQETFFKSIKALDVLEITFHYDPFTTKDFLHQLSKTIKMPPRIILFTNSPEQAIQLEYLKTMGVSDIEYDEY